MLEHSSREKMGIHDDFSRFLPDSVKTVKFSDFIFVEKIAIPPTHIVSLSHFLSRPGFAYLQKHAPFGMHSLLQKSKTLSLNTKKPPKNLFSLEETQNKRAPKKCPLWGKGFYGSACLPAPAGKPAGRCPV